MVFVFLNLARVENISPHVSPVRGEIIESKYLEYVKKVCPPSQFVAKAKIITKFTRKFHISSQNAEGIIDGMIKESILIINNDIELSSDMLANITRRLIYQHIEQYPGTYVYFIKSQLKLGTNQILWHLGILEEYKMVKYHKFGKIKAYYIGNIDLLELKLGFVLIKKNTRDILKILYNAPHSIAISQFTDTTQIPEITLRYTLNKFKKLEVVETILDKNQTHYFLSNNAKSILDKKMAIFNLLLENTEI